MNKYLILIPAYEPDMALVRLTAELCSYADVLVVNDGSSDKSTAIFEKAANDRVTVIGYATNRGKGHALKYGIKWATANHYTHIVTADADGQHTVKDIVNILHELKMRTKDLILGTRDKSQMPPRSKIGNSLTCWLFWALCGLSITDTQTGLRGICLTPEISEQLLALSGERYEYETNMLIKAKQIFENIVEIPIDTVYEPQNPTSHFRPIQDGLKIYKLLFQSLPICRIYAMISVLAEYGAFNLLCYAFRFPAVVATVIARIVGSGIEFVKDRHSEPKLGASAAWIGKALLCTTADCGCVWAFTQRLFWQPWVAKIAAMLMLYALNRIFFKNPMKRDDKKCH